MTKNIDKMINTMKIKSQITKKDLKKMCEKKLKEIIDR